MRDRGESRHREMFNDNVSCYFFFHLIQSCLAFCLKGFLNNTYLKILFYALCRAHSVSIPFNCPIYFCSNLYLSLTVRSFFSFQPTIRTFPLACQTSSGLCFLNVIIVSFRFGSFTFHTLVGDPIPSSYALISNPTHSHITLSRGPY